MEDVLDDIEDAITDNFSTYLTPLATTEVPLPLPSIVMDDVDLEKYRTDNVLFVTIDNGDVEFMTIASDGFKVRIVVVLATKGLDSANLRLRALRYFEAFCRMVKTKPVLSVCEWQLEGFDYYDDADGTGVYKGFEIRLLVEYEETV